MEKIGKLQADVVGLAPLFQKWAEMCRMQVGGELSAALQWYLAGRADAHAMDAQRVRELASPSVRAGPPRDGGDFVKAYEAFLSILQAVSSEAEIPRVARDDGGAAGDDGGMGLRSAIGEVGDGTG